MENFDHVLKVINTINTIKDDNYSPTAVIQVSNGLLLKMEKKRKKVIVPSLQKKRQEINKKILLMKKTNRKYNKFINHQITSFEAIRNHIISFFNFYVINIKKKHRKVIFKKFMNEISKSINIHKKIPDKTKNSMGYPLIGAIILQNVISKQPNIYWSNETISNFFDIPESILNDFTK